MDDNTKLPEGFSYDELAKAILDRLKPYLQEIVREELAALNNDSQQEKKQVRRNASMIATEPDIPDNGRYTVTKAAKILGVSRMTIKRHVDDKLLTPLPSKIKSPTTAAQKRVIQTFSGKELKRHWKERY